MRRFSAQVRSKFPKTSAATIARRPINIYIISHKGGYSQGGACRTQMTGGACRPIRAEPLTRSGGTSRGHDPVVGSRSRWGGDRPDRQGRPNTSKHAPPIRHSPITAKTRRGAIKTRRGAIGGAIKTRRGAIAGAIKTRPGAAKTPLGAIINARRSAETRGNTGTNTPKPPHKHAIPSLPIRQNSVKTARKQRENHAWTPRNTLIGARLGVENTARR
jgi:hypothetical protein